MIDADRRRRGFIFAFLATPVILAVMGYLFWSLRPLLLPIVIGILLAYLFRPLKSAFKYRWLPNGLRVALIFSGLTLGLLGTISFVKNNIPNEKEKLEILVRLKFKFNEKFQKSMAIDPATGKGNDLYNFIAQDINPLRASLNSYLDLSPDQTEAFLNYAAGVDGFEPVPDKYYQYFLTNINQRDPAAAKPEIGKSTKSTDKTEVATDHSLVKTLIHILSVWFLLPIVFVVFLVDEGTIAQFFIRMVPNRYFELALTVLEEVDAAIGKYLRGLSMECGLVAITMAAGLFVAGFSLTLSLLIGLVSGIATSIPMVGPVVGLSLGLTYALIAEEVTPLLPLINDGNLFVAVLIVNTIVIALDNVVFQPIVLGSAVNLHPLVVILGIMGASMLFGITGVLLAIPTIVVTKAVVQNTFRGLKDYRII